MRRGRRWRRGGEGVSDRDTRSSTCQTSSLPQHPFSLLTSTATLLFYCEEYLRPRRSPTSEIFSRASSSCSRVCDDDRQKRARLSMMGVAGYLKINDDACLFFVCFFVCLFALNIRNCSATRRRVRVEVRWGCVQGNVRGCESAAYDENRIAHRLVWHLPTTERTNKQTNKQTVV